MRQQLFDNNFMILDEFIPRDDALKLAEIFKTDCERAESSWGSTGTKFL